MPDLTAVAVLAAGASSRLGSPKQLVHIGGLSLIRRAVGAAVESRVGPVFVALGAHRDVVEPELHDLPARLLINDDWSEGIASSIRLAVCAAQSIAVPALLLMLCDQPGVDAALLSRIVAAHTSPQRARIVATRYADTLGVPALFDRSLFDELLTLRGDEGARSIIRRRAADAVAIDPPAALADIDTPADRAAGGSPPV